MATTRTVRTSAWTQDEWFSGLSHEGKLLWLWMQTNDSAGDKWQSLSRPRIQFETGINEKTVTELVAAFEGAGRIEVNAERNRFRIFVSDTRCAKCGAGFDITVDHIKPRSWGGTNETDNLQWLCRHCNSSKGNRHETRY